MPFSDTDAILARIDARLEKLQISSREASAEGTGSEYTIRNMRRGSKPSVDALEGLAGVLGVSPAFLAFGVGTEEHPGPATARPSMPPIAQVPIIGQVAAGHWLEISTQVDAPLYDASPIPPDPDFKLDEQFAVEVSGTSINRIAPDGAILGCVDVQKARLPPRDGDLVIVEQRRNGGQEVMRTAKLFHDLGDRVELHPDSDDPRWRSPIVIDRNAEPDDGVEVAVIGIVTWIHAPMSRVKRSRRV